MMVDKDNPESDKKSSNDYKTQLFTIDTFFKMSIMVIGITISVIGWVGNSYVSSVSGALERMEKRNLSIEKTLIKLENSLNRNNQDVASIKRSLHTIEDRSYKLRERIYKLEERISLIENQNYKDERKRR